MSHAIEQETKFKARFKLYYILKSTAWITPIFFLFLQNQVGLNTAAVLKIAGLLMILPLLTDTPLGLLADRIGARKLLSGGTLFQFLSMSGLLFLPASLGYLTYLVSILIADNCYSGAEQSFLSENIASEKDIRAFLKELNQSFYIYTIPALIGGVVLYQINPYLPLIVQAFSFLLAFFAIVNFPTAKRANSETEPSAFFPLQLMGNFKFVLTNRSLVGTLLVGITFGALVQINAKTIQGQIQSAGPSHLALWLGCSYVFGNLISGFAASFWNRLRIGHSEFVRQIAILFGIMFFSQALTASSSVIALVASFMLLSAVKSIYRPLLSGEQIATLRLSPELAANLSVLSTMTTLALSGLHILNSFFVERLHLGNFPLVLLLSAPLLFAMQLISSKSSTWVKMNSTSYSGKQNLIGRFKRKKAVKQIYPEAGLVPNFGTAAVIAARLNVQWPAVLAFSDCELVTEYVEGKSIFALESYDQKRLVARIVKAVHAAPAVGTLIPSMPYAGAHFLEFLSQTGADEIRQALSAEHFEGLCHGDFNPHNIIIVGTGVMLVDWDLCGEGYAWFDTLSLTTHPDLSLSEGDRVELICEALDLDAATSRYLIGQFCAYKAHLLEDFGIPGLEAVICNYRVLQERLNGIASA